MTRRAILHIGTEKTGSTSIQQLFARNRRWLAASGFHAAKAAGAPNNVKLFSYAVGDPRLAFGVGDRAEQEKLRRKLEADLARERDAHPDSTFLFSNEHCHSRLFSAEEIARLRALLAPLFDEIKVLVYLRRQDLLAVSLYSTLLKAGVSSREVLVTRPIPSLPAAAPEQRLYYDHQALLARWAEGFGAGSLAVRRFEAGALVGGDVVSDFADAVGLPPPPREAERANESLVPEFQEYLRLINRHLRVDKGATRGEIVRVASEIGKGTGRLPARAAAMAFLDRFAGGNEAVRQAHFPDVPSLFDQDFSRYPDQADTVSLDVDAMSRISAQVLRAMAGELQDRSAELARFRKGDESADPSRPKPARPPAPVDQETRALRRKLRQQARRGGG